MADEFTRGETMEDANDRLNKAVESDDLEAARQALADGADASDFGSFFLVIAAAKNNIEMLKLLLPYGDMEADGENIFNTAAIHGYVEIAKTILPHVVHGPMFRLNLIHFLNKGLTEIAENMIENRPDEAVCSANQIGILILENEVFSLFPKIEPFCDMDSMLEKAKEDGVDNVVSYLLSKFEKDRLLAKHIDTPRQTVGRTGL